MSHAWLATVVDPEATRRERLRQLQRQFGEALAELDGAIRDARAFAQATGTPVEDLGLPVSRPEWGPGEDEKQGSTAAADARRLRDEVSAAVARARVKSDLAARVSRLQSTAGAGSLVRVEDVLESLDVAPKATTTVRAAGESESPTPEEVERVLGRLDPDVTAEERHQALTLGAATLSDLDHPLASGLLDELRDHVSGSSKQARRRRHHRTSARDALARLQGGPVDPSLAEALARVESGTSEWSNELERRVENALNLREVAAQRKVVADGLADALGDLGYDVHRDVRGVTEEGEVVFTRPEWGSYAVTGRTDDQQRVQLCLLRTEEPRGSHQIRDREVEEQFCTDIERLRAGLASGGMTLEQEQIIGTNGGPLPVNSQLADLQASARTDSGRHRRGSGRRGRG